MNVATFKSNLKNAALSRQAELNAKADRIDELARGLRKHNPLSLKISHLNDEARTLRDEAGRIGDRYHQLAGA